MEPELHGITEIGGTKVFTKVWPEADLINDRLAALVRAKKGDAPSPWRSEADFAFWNEPAVDSLLTMLRTMLREVVRATVPSPDERMFKGWDIRARANVHEFTDSTAPHNHDVGGLTVWSAVYYVNAGEDPGADNGGVTRFMDMSGVPRPVSEAKDYSLEVEPEPGKMLIFPTTLPHYVTPYLGRNQLITITAKLVHRDFIVPDPQNPQARTSRMWRDFRGPMLALEKGRRAARGLRRTLLGDEGKPNKP
ncbi:hypothetical protein GCM10023321_08250 [Pseudonocardia eucalypti]|uniref:2OG-Fe(II) oxygenase n=1 Tax=Pseudonocardia eucalypti TaxID=648755 RepID=A0ABP9PJ85_9PSEU|nr:hypothetical protein [Pseudonocardia eucalypti]